jgi:hypothetical protein
MLEMFSVVTVVVVEKMFKLRTDFIIIGDPHPSKKK